VALAISSGRMLTANNFKVTFFQAFDTAHCFSMTDGRAKIAQSILSYPYIDFSCVGSKVWYDCIENLINQC
jgi:hypothetical protein